MTAMTAIEVLGQGLTVIGGVIFFLAGWGLWLLRDPYMRISSVGTAAGLGVSFVMVGTLLTDPSVSAGIKVALAVLLQLLTSAVGAIVIARAAVLSGHQFHRTADHAGVLGGLEPRPHDHPNDHPKEPRDDPSDDPRD